MSNQINVSQTRRLIRHGLWVLLLGLCCGFGLGFAINGEVSISPLPIAFDYTMAAEPRAWRAAHVGGITNGLMALLLAILMPYFALRATAVRHVVTGLIVVIWGNTMFYIASLWAPNRGLSLGDTVQGAGNLAGIIAYVPAVIAAVTVIVIVAYLAITLPKENEL